jgi:hypothetical protein
MRRDPMLRSCRRGFPAAILILVSLAGVAPPAGAGPNDGTKFALHWSALCDKCIPDVCGEYSPNTSGLPCSEFDTRIGFLPGSQVGYLVIVGADFAAGVSGLQFGIWFDEEAWNYGYWTLCADMESPHASVGGDPWPQSGSGNRVTWTGCERTTFGKDGVRAVAGAWFLSSYNGEYAGSFAVTPDSSLADPAFILIDCAQQETPIKTLGGVLSTTAGAGYNPCLADTTVSVTASTWGRLKTRFGPDQQP